MIPKTIDRKSGRIFEYKLDDLCICRSQEDQEDYGVDYELEMLDQKGKATGLILKVQQKGAKHVTVSRDGKWVLYADLPLEKMKYYLKDMSIPIFFVVVDASDERMWWTRLQGEPEVENAYRAAVAADHKTMTVRLPAANMLPDTLDKMFEARTEAKTSILLSTLRSTTADSLVAAAKDDLFANKQLLVEQANILRSLEIEILRSKGDYTKVYAESSSIFRSESEQIEMRFSSALHVLATFPAVATKTSELERAEEIEENRKTVTNSLFQLTIQRSDKKNLHAFARVLLRSSLLARVVGEQLGLRLTLSFRLHSENVPADPAALAGQIVSSEKILSAFHRAQVAFHRLIKLRAYGFVPYSWRQISMDIIPFLLNFDGNGLNEIKLQVIAWLDSTLPLVLGAAQAMNDSSALGVCAVSFAQYALAFVNDKATYDKRIAFVRSTIASIPEVPTKTKYTGIIDRMLSQLEAARKAVPTPEQMQEIRRYAERAAKR